MRLIKCSRAWVSTCTVTSSGIIPRSISARVNSNSTWEAAGKPISISLKPMSTKALKKASFSSRFMGSTSA